MLHSPLVLGLLAAALVHALAVLSAPVVMTEQAFGRLIARGLEPNRLHVSAIRKAGEDVVPLSNPDMLMARAILDLSDGPQRLAATAPDMAAYWSISVFARNTDVAFLESDRTERGQRQYVFAREGQPVQPGPGETLVVLEDDRNYLLVRVAASDPTDADQVSSIQRSMSAYRLTRYDARALAP